MRYGSLCSGIGGLDRAVEMVWPDATPAWFCEFDQHAASVLHRWWPGVPVLPDLKTQDWTTVEPVELVTAGYPCQPFSQAGKRQGAADPRHLWPFVIDAVRALRPRLVILENVSGHLGLGFDIVLGDLAEAGFDAEWCVVPASAAGACHRRERLFVLAHNTESEPGIVEHGERLCAVADASGERHGSGQDGGRVGRVDGGDAGEARQRERSRSLAGDRSPTTTADAARAARGEPQQQGAGSSAGPAAELGERPSASARSAAPDVDDIGRERGGAHGDGGPDLRTAVANAYGVAGQASGALDRRQGPLDEPGEVQRTERLPGVAWGDYGPAIKRWEHVIGRPAPRPTDDKGRLSVDFVEWMQGFDAGWVQTLDRSPALRCLGNAVVQQQGVMALEFLRGAL